MGCHGSRRPRPLHAALWASLVPLLLLLHPYGGLIQDARIYIGRGVADRDPAGVGRDIVFAHDAQTGFSLMRLAVRAMLDVMPPSTASMLLALAGSLLWLAAAMALLRRLAPERVAWAAAVAVLALPARYGAFGVFGYAETVATPRVFAEAAVLGGMAALLGRRRPLGLALLALAVALHPIMAAPGLGIAALSLVRDDRRWTLPLAAAGAAVLTAAALKLPLSGRLFETMDPEWWSILRQRCVYLFPTQWPAEAFAQGAAQVAAAILAGSLLPPRERTVLWGTVGVAACGVAVSFLFGDLLPGTLVTQMQPWRALWPLAVLGNASLALAAAGLWRRGPTGRSVLALLVMGWCAGAAPLLSLTLSVAAVALWAMARSGPPAAVTPRLAVLAGGGAAVLAISEVAVSAKALLGLAASAAGGAGDMSWPLAVAAGVQSIPLAAAAAAVALALRPTPGRPGTAPTLVAWASVAAACAAAVLLWDGRTAERRAVEGGSGAAALRDAIGPAAGEVLWVDENAENWFLIGRPAVFDALQGAPILFSREMALDWAARARDVRGLGLARDLDLAPWAPSEGRADDLALSPASVGRFCADARHPAGLVAPGAQLGAVPAGLAAALWRPPVPFRRLVVGDDGGFRWRSIEAFTVVRCAGQVGGAGEQASLKSVRTD